MGNKIALFVASLSASNLITYLIQKNILSCVVVANQNNEDSHNLIQALHHHKVPYFLYDEDDTKNIQSLKNSGANMALSFGFSFKISPSVIEYFNESIFNIHASALPKYRGKNPIFWQLRNGEESSALVIHKITKEFDEGEIVLKKEFDIDYHDTFGILNGMVSQLVVNLVDHFLEEFKQEKIVATAQIGDLSLAKEVIQKDIIIDWKNMKSIDIYNLTRACNPIFGGAKSMWKDVMLNIFETTIMDMDNLGLEAGTIIHIGSPEGLIVSTIDGAIRIDLISVPDGIFSGLRFAKRFKIDVGEKLSTVKI